MTVPGLVTGCGYNRPAPPTEPPPMPPSGASGCLGVAGISHTLHHFTKDEMAKMAEILQAGRRKWHAAFLVSNRDFGPKTSDQILLKLSGFFGGLVLD